MSEQIAYGTVDFAANPEPRCPCVLLLDVSGSMSVTLTPKQYRSEVRFSGY